MKPATTAKSFMPASLSLLPAGLPSGLSFATRTIYLHQGASGREGELQYLVFKEGFNTENDPRLNQVLGSGFTLEHACLSAISIHALISKVPADFWPRLAGYTFTKRASEDGSTALQHCCTNALGQEVSHAETREVAARLAMHHALAGCLDMSFEEYRAISVTAQIQTSIGKRTYGALFDDELGQNNVRKMVINGFQQNPAYRQAAYAELERALALPPPVAPAPSAASRRREKMRDKVHITPGKTKEANALNALITSVNKAILSKAFCTFNLDPEGSTWIAKIITHPSSISGEQALHNSYSHYLQSSRETLLDQERQARETAVGADDEIDAENAGVVEAPTSS